MLDNKMKEILKIESPSKILAESVCAGMEEAEEAKPIEYKDCATAMMYMWLNEIVTDSQYNKIMDKLNAKHKEGLI